MKTIFLSILHIWAIPKVTLCVSITVVMFRGKTYEKRNTCPQTFLILINSLMLKRFKQFPSIVENLKNLTITNLRTVFLILCSDMF